MAKEYKLDEYSEGILNIINQYKKTSSYKKEIEAIRKEAQKEQYDKILNFIECRMSAREHVCKDYIFDKIDLEIFKEKFERTSK